MLLLYRSMLQCLLDVTLKCVSPLILCVNSNVLYASVALMNVQGICGICFPPGLLVSHENVP